MAMRHKRKLPGAALAATLALALPSAAQAGTVEFGLPTAEAFPVGITTGPDGNLWLTEYEGDRLARVTPAGAVTELPPLDADSGPAAITAGPDGALWFTEARANRIARMTVDGALSEFGGLSPTHTDSDGSGMPAGPQAIVAGPDGNLWFTEPGAGAIARITPSGNIVEYPLPAGGEPRGLAFGPDGALWFTEFTGNRIGRLANGKISEYALPTADSKPFGITPGPDGRLWFTEYGGNRVGAITTDGAISELPPLELADSRPAGIVAGSDGALWFTEEGGNRLGRVTTDAALTESPALAAAHSLPNRIAAGPDGNLWFTESSAGVVGRATLDVPPLVRTGDATGLTMFGATLNGSVNPSRSPTTFWFEYGFTRSYGTSTSDQSLPSGHQPLPASAGVGDLPPGTLVHYRVVARNANGRTPGADRTFATLPESAGLGSGPAQPPRLPPVRLTLTAKPRRDRRAPYAYSAQGTVVLPPGVSAKSGCRGEVVLWLRRGRRTIAAAPGPIASDCSFTGRVRVSARRALDRVQPARHGKRARHRRRAPRGTLTLVARFPGNAALLHRTARMTVRFG
jgi:streptogramin lyase